MLEIENYRNGKIYCVVFCYTHLLFCLVTSLHSFTDLSKDKRMDIFYKSYQKLTRLPIDSLYERLTAKKSLRSHIEEQITALATNQVKVSHLLDALNVGIDLGLTKAFESLLEAMGECTVNKSSQLVTSLFASVQQRIETAIQQLFNYDC